VSCFFFAFLYNLPVSLSKNSRRTVALIVLWDFVQYDRGKILRQFIMRYPV